MTETYNTEYIVSWCIVHMQRFETDEAMHSSRMCKYVNNYTVT